MTLENGKCKRKQAGEHIYIPVHKIKIFPPTRHEEKQQNTFKMQGIVNSLTRVVISILFFNERAERR